MTPSDCVFVAGHHGLAGSAIVRRLRDLGHGERLLLRTRSALDLADVAATEAFFAAHRPAYVFLAAARVGGIQANATRPADFIADNLAIQSSVIGAAHRHGVRRLVFLGSSCIYPRMAEQPLRESSLLSGPLEATNRPYAVAKIAGIELCWSLNRQHGTQFLCAMPTNLYGPGDNYDLEDSHVLPALLRRFHEARLRDDPAVTLWGTGTPRREFMHSDDMAAACVHLMSLPDERFAGLLGNASLDEFDPPLVNIGVGHDLTIAALASMVREVVGYRGEVHFDSNRPDGTPRKLLDISRLRATGWQPAIELPEGLARTYADFVSGPQRGIPYLP